jgi:hypothetical protein
MDKPIAHFIITKVLLILCAAVTAPFWYPRGLVGIRP